MPIFIAIYWVLDENTDKPFEALFSRFKRVRGFWGMLVLKNGDLKKPSNHAPYRGAKIV